MCLRMDLYASKEDIKSEQIYDVVYIIFHLKSVFKTCLFRFLKNIHAFIYQPPTNILPFVMICLFLECTTTNIPTRISIGLCATH